MGGDDGRRHDGGRNADARRSQEQGRDRRAKSGRPRRNASRNGSKESWSATVTARRMQTRRKKAAEPLEHFKEMTKGHRWVAITGVFDHAQLVANYRTALKNPAVAHPNYSRVDLERQTKLPDGSWSDWEAVSSKENLKILDNLPEVEEEELTPDTVRPEALVDPLPFLKSGLWEKVHVASLVPKEKKEIKKQETGQGGMMGGGMMGGE